MKNIQFALSFTLAVSMITQHAVCWQIHGSGSYRSYAPLASSKFNINLITPGAGPKELPDPDAVKAIEKLLGTPKEMSMDDVKSKIGKSKLKGSTPSQQMEAILDIAMDQKIHILLTESSPAFNEPDIYVAESELHKLWLSNSEKPMGKPVDRFELLDALLLLEDDDDAFMAEASETDGETSAAVEEGDVKGNNEPEIFVTRAELERIWNERSFVAWGMPGKEYSDFSALLLLDDTMVDSEDEDAEEGELVEYVSTRHNVLDSDNPEFWEENRDPSMQEALKKIYAELEDSSFRRPAWKKERYDLTPDIDTQQFVGNIMQSNTYMTQRIPMNWDDKEEEGMSEAYLSTSSMSWPGEEETDYNKKVPVWEQLGLPVGPGFDPKTGRPIAQKEMPLKDSKLEENVDWSTFDFAAADSDNKKTTSDAIDVDKFFEKMDESTSKDTPPGEDDDEELDTELQLTTESISGNLITRSAARNQKNWVTPKKWLQNPEYLAAVPFETWSQYDEAEFTDLNSDGSPIFTSDDIYTAISVHHILRVTDQYLTNHIKLNEIGAERRYWERVLQAKLANDESLLREAIPVYLTPDKDRGIEYTQEVIEMKSKITLEVKLNDPAIEYANDTFTPNEELQPINKIGTIRDQYDWKNITSSSTWKIDPRVVKKIQPVIDYINHAGILRSTVGNVLVFEYLGNMRQILGIRASMKEIAKKCLPDLVDVRLETLRSHDKFDA